MSYSGWKVRSFGGFLLCRAVRDRVVGLNRSKLLLFSLYNCYFCLSLVSDEIPPWNVVLLDFSFLEIICKSRG